MPGYLDWRIADHHLRHRDPSLDERRPDPSRPVNTDCLPNVRHIVLLMMENHSFDNYFGTLGRGEGLTRLAGGGWEPANEKLNGAVVRPYRFASTVQHSGVPTQTWRASHIQYANGANDGFVESIEQTVPGGDPRVAMGFWDEQHLPFYASLARTFPLANRWHSSLLGPTFPNRRFLMAATANGLIDDILVSMDYPRNGTIFDLLDRYGIDWANYHHVATPRILAKRILGNGGLRGARALRTLAAKFVPALLHAGTGDLQFTADIYPNGFWRCRHHLRHISAFFDDARGSRLPPVSIVDPDFQACSEENPQDVQVGEGFAAAVINAVMAGPAWRETLLIWFYDEHGGYFDHVAPPMAVEPDRVLPHSLLEAGGPIRWLLGHLGFEKKLEDADAAAGRYDRLGFRVPAVVVSPYARAGHVSDTVYDHTSALKLIERKWNLPPLTARDAAAADPLDMVDFDTPPAFDPPPRLALPARPWTPPRR